MNKTLLSAVAAALLLAASDASAFTRARYLMGTVCEISSGSPADIEAAFREAARVEKLISTWRVDSELAVLNRSGSAQLSPEVAALLADTARWAERTGGAFNPLAGGLVKAWGLRGEGSIPDDATIASAIASAKLSNLSQNGPEAVLTNGAVVEEGGFGKGYAIDRMLALAGEHTMVVNFGGQLGVKGSAAVTIADPQDRGKPVIGFTLRDGSLSTSSGSEKTFAKEGRTFSHIVDPRTGQALPPRGSASVVADDAFTADVLSTALYVLGPEAGLHWADTNRVSAVFITPDRLIRLSAAFRERVRDVQLLDKHFAIKD